MDSKLYCSRSTSLQRISRARLALPAALALLAALMLAACGGGGASKVSPQWPVTGGSNNIPSGVGNVGPGDSTTPTGTGLTGGVMLHFSASTSGNGPNETFAVWLTHELSIEAFEQAWNGTTQPVNHISGLVRSGAGLRDHNLPWGWHFDGTDIVSVNPFDRTAGGPVFRLPAPVWPQRIQDGLTQYASGTGQYIYCTLTAFDDRR